MDFCSGEFPGDISLRDRNKNPPGEPEGIKQLKTNYREQDYKDLIWSLAIQERIDRADRRIIILIGLHFVVTIKVLYVGDRII